MQRAHKTKFRVLIGDSSVRTRMVLSGLIDAEPNLEVVDTAQSKEELLYKAFSFLPDIIVTHPGLTMSGNLPSFQQVYGEDTSLLLMVSQEMAAHSNPLNRKMKVVKEEPETGVLDKNNRLKDVASRILHKLKEFVQKCGFYSYRLSGPQISSGEYFSAPQPTFSSFVKTTKAPLAVVALGASTGGSTALEYLLKDLQVTEPTVVLVAVHMPEKFTKRLAKRLQKVTGWKVMEGEQGMELRAGTVVIAPGGKNMMVRKKPFDPFQLYLELEEAMALDSPSVDKLFQSAAACAKEQVLGVILTGMGKDGTSGAHEIRRNGGVVIAQDEETSSIFGMAKSAIESGAIHGVFALGQINSIIYRFVSDRNQSQALQTSLIG